MKISDLLNSRCFCLFPFRWALIAIYQNRFEPQFNKYFFISSSFSVWGGLWPSCMHELLFFNFYTVIDSLEIYFRMILVKRPIHPFNSSSDISCFFAFIQGWLSVIFLKIPFGQRKHWVTTSSGTFARSAWFHWFASLRDKTRVESGFLLSDVSTYKITIFWLLNWKLTSETHLDLSSAFMCLE